MASATQIAGTDEALWYDRFETSTYDLPGWIALGRRSSTPVLELGCGTGRVTWALAGAHIESVGLDVSPAMLERAASKRIGRPKARFELADMLELDLGRRFDLIIAPARVLELLATDDDLDLVLAGARDHLASDGCLAFHLSDPPASDQPEVSAVAVRGDHVWQERLDRKKQLRSVSVLIREEGQVIGKIGPQRFRWRTSAQLDRALRRASLHRVESWRGVGLQGLQGEQGALRLILCAREGPTICR